MASFCSQQITALLGERVLVPYAHLVGDLLAAYGPWDGYCGDLARDPGSVSGFNGSRAVVPFVWHVGPSELDARAAPARVGLSPVVSRSVVGPLHHVDGGTFEADGVHRSDVPERSRGRGAEPVCGGTPARGCGRSNGDAALGVRWIGRDGRMRRPSDAQQADH